MQKYLTNRREMVCISFSMEKRTEYLFYMGIQSKNNENQSKQSRMISKTTSRVVLPFHNGQLVVYGVFIPRELIMPVEKGFRWQKKHREKRRMERLYGIICEAAESVRGELAGERITYCYASDEITKHLPPEIAFCQESDGDTLSDRLYEAYLFRRRQTDQEPVFSLSLPKECGELMVMRLLNIVEPYLPRVNEILFVGVEDAGAKILEDYLYDEYGIVMNYGRFPLKNAIWIDFEEQQEQKLLKYAKENEICHINSAEVLKFLDTVAKNGYNTKVN